MATSDTFLVLTLMCFLVSTGAETCKSSMCPTSCYPSFQFNPTIDFPFLLKSAAGQSDRCGYPGFELSCDNNNQTIISMPSSGEFTVTSIDYQLQKIRVNDPENWMPGRYLADFTVDFPFQLDALYGLRNFTFVNCTAANDTYPPYYVDRFPCLSGPNYTVGAYLGYNNSLFGCQVIRTVSVPSKWAEPRFYGDVSLSWNQPDCTSCRGSCGFKSRSGLKIACFDSNPRHHRKGLSSRAKFGIIIAPVLGFMVLSGLVCHFNGKVTSQNEQEPNPNAWIAQPVPIDVVTMGLSSSAIELYPKHVFGDSVFKLLNNSVTISRARYVYANTRPRKK